MNVRRRRPLDLTKQTIWTYRRHALTHYVQGAIALPILGFAVLTSSILWALGLLAVEELLVLALLPRFEAFRRYVDDRMHETACVRAAFTRVALLAQISDEHRRELEQLEDLVARVRALGGLDDAASHEWLGLDGLLASYVRLAIAHRASEMSFRATEDGKLALKIAELEIVRTTRTGDARAWADRRLALLYDRRTTLQRAREDRALLTEQIATIGELVRWVHEEVARARCADVREEVTERLAECVRSASTLREVAALVGTVDVAPEVLRLGRLVVPTPEMIAASAPAVVHTC